MNDVPPPPPPPYGSSLRRREPRCRQPRLSYGFNKYFANVGPVLAVIFIPVVAQLVVSSSAVRASSSLFGSLVFEIIGVVRRRDRWHSASTTWP